MTIPTLTTLPVAPARTDPPATFVTRADAFLAAIVTFQGEMNTSIGAMNTDIAGVNTDATAAAASASAAASSATAAANAAGAALWVSGQAYAEGDAAISGVNYQTYRAETATSGTTDPSLDANWTAISGTFPDQSGNAGKYLTTDGTDASWAVVEALPEQSGNAGNYLTTDGTDASWGELSLNPPLGAIDAGGLVLTNTAGTALISLSGASLAISNPQGYAGVGREDGASYTDITSPHCAKYSTYYKRWFAVGYGWGGQSSANDLSLWSSVDGITWAIFSSLRFLLGTSWSGVLTTRNNWDSPFAIDESNGRIWVAGVGTATTSIRLGYLDPSSGNSEGTLVDIGINSGSSNGQICWMECLEPANIIYIVLQNTNFEPKFAYIPAGGTTGTFLGSGGSANENYQKWRFCYNYDPETSNYRIALVVGDQRQVYWLDSTNPIQVMNGPVNSSGGATYDHAYQIMMNTTHLMWTKSTTIYYKPFAGNAWRTNTNWSTRTGQLDITAKAMNYNSFDGFTYTITQRGQIHRFTDPTSTIECIGTTGFGIADNGDTRIRFRST
jgi:hypothetical protein